MYVAGKIAQVLEAGFEFLQLQFGIIGRQQGELFGDGFEITHLLVVLGGFLHQGGIHAVVGGVVQLAHLGEHELDAGKPGPFMIDRCRRQAGRRHGGVIIGKGAGLQFVPQALARRQIAIGLDQALQFLHRLGVLRHFEDEDIAARQWRARSAACASEH